MGFFDRLADWRKDKKAESRSSGASQPEGTTASGKRVGRWPWRPPPDAQCQVCGEDLWGLKPSGFMGIGEGLLDALIQDIVDFLFKGALYVCPKCCFTACFDCCRDPQTHKLICRECGSTMERA